MKACVDLLKPGALFLVYLYYRFDNRPIWFRAFWNASDLMRGITCRLPAQLKSVVTDAITATMYWPLARSAALPKRRPSWCATGLKP